MGLTAIAAILLVTQSGVLKRQDKWQETGPSIPVISTRGHFVNGELRPGDEPYSYDLVDGAEGPAAWNSLSGDVIIVIHGFNNSAEKASVKFHTAELSLRSCGFAGSIIGYSWDANTQKDPFGTTGYHEGRGNAIANGRKLASFIADCKREHPEARIHLIGYSMGARLVLETLLALDNDPRFAESDDLQVASVHLVGAAVDNEEVEQQQRYGIAVESRTQWLYNYYSREDNALGMFYPLKEGDRALGEGDIEHAERAPRNYQSIDIESELLEIDKSTGQPASETGDNHSACLGILGEDGELLDDGIMDVVLRQINRLFGGNDTAD